MNSPAALQWRDSKAVLPQHPFADYGFWRCFKKNISSSLGFSSSFMWTNEYRGWDCTGVWARCYLWSLCLLGRYDILDTSVRWTVVAIGVNRHSSAGIQCSCFMWAQFTCCNVRGTSQFSHFIFPTCKTEQFRNPAFLHLTFESLKYNLLRSQLCEPELKKNLTSSLTSMNH